MIGTFPRNDTIPSFVMDEEMLLFSISNLDSTTEHDLKMTYIRTTRFSGPLTVSSINTFERQFDAK